MTVEGMATVLPFHRAVVRDPAFIGDENGFTVHTRWIETQFDNTIPPFGGAEPAGEDAPRQTVVVEVGGRRLEVSLPGDLAFSGGGSTPAGAAARPRKRSASKAAAAVSGDAVAAPMQGTIVKVAVEDGQQLAVGDLVVVLEAMKMENPVTAHKAGTVTGLAVATGDAVTQGTVLLEIKD
jgi:acetyl-CoA/propionyl-CoA carboxylase biotin carboxyl carrier protein